MADARNAKLDVTELGQQMASIGAVAPVRLASTVESRRMAIHRRRHFLLDNPSDRLPPERTIAFAPLQTIGPHRLHESKRHW